MTAILVSSKCVISNPYSTTDNLNLMEKKVVGNCDRAMIFVSWYLSANKWGK